MWSDSNIQFITTHKRKAGCGVEGEECKPAVQKYIKLLLEDVKTHLLKVVSTTAAFLEMSVP